MAIFTPSFGPMSGSISGNTFSHNKGGPYVRRRSIPVNPSSSKQTVSRNHLATAAQYWANTLTAPNRAAWDAYAAVTPFINRLGASIFVSGESAFVGLSAALLAGGDTIIATPPLLSGPAGLTTATAVYTAPSSIVVTYTPTPLPAGARLVLWGTLPDKISVNPNERQSRLLGYSAAAAISPQTIVSPYAGVVGQYVNLYAGVQDAAGRQSVRTLVRSPLV